MATITESEIIADVWTVDPDRHGDERGHFFETYRRSWFPLGREMVQGNRSDKAAGAVVGLHYHLHQADYWLCTKGRARVVLHDLRVARRPMGRPNMLEISEDNCRGVFIPPGVAHGFASLTDLTLTYLVDSYYNPEDELGRGLGRPGDRRRLGGAASGAVGSGSGQPAPGGHRSGPAAAPGPPHVTAPDDRWSRARRWATIAGVSKVLPEAPAAGSKSRSALLLGLVRTARVTAVAEERCWCSPPRRGRSPHPCRTTRCGPSWRFAAFCAVSSGTYFINDAVDAEADREPSHQAAPAGRGRHC